MIKHEDVKFLNYAPEQLYELVCDIQKYPEFLPWCTGAALRSDIPTETGRRIEADLVISFTAFKERFGSVVDTNDEKMEIVVNYLDGPFKTLRNFWKFSHHEGGSNVEFMVEFAFKSRMLEMVAGRVFGEAMRQIVNSFEQRARDLYGETR